MGLPLVAAAVGAGRSLIQGFGTASMDSYQAKVAQYNAQTAQTNALWTTEAGDVAATNKGLQVRAAIGQQKASQGAAGVDVNSGSAADVRTGARETGLLDAMTIRSNASKEAYGQEVQATSDLNQASLDKSAASQAIVGGVLGAGEKAFGAINPTSGGGGPTGTDAVSTGPMQLEPSLLSGAGTGGNQFGWSNPWDITQTGS